MSWLASTLVSGPTLVRLPRSLPQLSPPASSSRSSIRIEGVSERELGPKVVVDDGVHDHGDSFAQARSAVQMAEPDTPTSSITFGRPE
jgi:hypothetical protein